MSKRWYVVHAYSGFEKSVMRSLAERIERQGMQDVFGRILVPVEEVVELKLGQKSISERKFFPGYVLVEMNLTEESWFLVRNTPGVTGFVGTSTTPTPVSNKEMDKIKKRMGVEDPKHNIEFTKGELVSIIDGPFKGFDGAVDEIDPAKGKLKVLVSMFARETPVELDALQVKAI